MKRFLEQNCSRSSCSRPGRRRISGGSVKTVAFIMLCRGRSYVSVTPDGHPMARKWNPSALCCSLLCCDDVLRANYGQNPWQGRVQVVTSVWWVSIVEDARESLLRSRWDLVIADEEHKMSARSDDQKTYAFPLG